MSAVCASSDAWAWLLPRNQNLVNSISLATTAVSDSFAIFAVALYNKFGFRFHFFLLGLSFLSLLAAVVSYYLVPTKAQHRRHIAVITALATAAQAEQQPHDDDGGVGYMALDVANGRSDVSRDSAGTHNRRHRRRCRCCRVACKEQGNQLKLVWYTARAFPVANALFVAFIVGVYMFVIFPIQQQLYYLTALMGHAQATRLVDLFAIVYGSGGALSALFMGTVVDKLGLRRTLMVTLALFVALLVAMLSPNFIMQVLGLCIMTLIFNFVSIIALRFALVYSPGENFGTYSGAMIAFLAISQVVLSPVVALVRAKAFSFDSVPSFTSVYIFFGACSVIGALVLVVYWAYRPHPAAGTVTVERVMLAKRHRSAGPS